MPCEVGRPAATSRSCSQAHAHAASSSALPARHKRTMNERQRAAQAALAADLDNEPESMTEAAQKIYAERRRKEERAKRKV